MIFDDVIINVEKLRQYCLNLNHPVGKHKAIGPDDSEELKKLIEEKVKGKVATESFSDKYGQRFYVDIAITEFENIEIVRTLWIVKPNETVPRFISCYIKNH